MNVHPTVAKKHGMTSRLFLVLIDGEAHQLSEFWDWLVDAVPPPLAIRRYLRAGSMGRRQKAAEDPEWAITEGHRMRILELLWDWSKKGIADITLPNPEEPRSPKANGWIDVHKATVRLTQKGRDYLLNRPGVLSKSIAELVLGLRRGKLDLTVYANKKSIPPREDQSDNLPKERPCTPATDA